MIKLLIDDGMQVRVGTGIGKYTINLYEGLMNDNEVSVKMDSFESSGGRKLKRLKYIGHINNSSYLKKLEEYDVVHYTNFLMPFRHINKAKTIVTIHDLTAFLYPDTLPKSYRAYNRYAIQTALKHADAIITVSQSVKSEIINQFSYCNPDKIHVIYPGISRHISKLQNGGCKEYENLKLKAMEGNKFFLFVGTVEKRKNLSIVIKAFFKFKKKYDEEGIYKLVLAGRPGFGFDEYMSIINASSYKDDVIVTGYISDSDCDLLYNKAESYIFPTIYEGFGIPTVECMTCDLPIILSNIPVNHEVAGKYGRYFNLDNIDTLVDAMAAVYNKRPELDGEEFLKRFQNQVIIEQYKCLIKGLLRHN